MISVQKVEDGVHLSTSLISILLTQIAVYNGVTHDPQNPFVVDLLDLQWQQCALVVIFISAVAVIISNHNKIIALWFSTFNK